MNKATQYFYLILVLLLSGCSSSPYPTEQAASVSFESRAVLRENEHLRIHSAVLSPEEAQTILGVDLSSRWLQAIWIQVENSDDVPHWLLLPSVDKNYYPPDEAAYVLRFLAKDHDTEHLMRHFRDIGFDPIIGPRSKVSGFVFVSMDLDAKKVEVKMFSDHGLESFEYIMPIAKLRASTLFDIEDHPAFKEPRDVDEPELREYLRGLPCCTTSKNGKINGDPLNLVLVGNAEDIFTAFVRRNWHATEPSYFFSVKKTISSYLFGERYIYSPISPLYAFDRHQDVAFQQTRSTIDQRNHLRLWLTPLKYKGKHVWVGQISRDIGVRLTTQSPFLFTHVVDPNVDETRDIFIQDMLLSGAVEKVGYVRGGPASSEKAPAQNRTGDPYFTDGNRAVMVLDMDHDNPGSIDIFPWARDIFSSGQLTEAH